MPASPQLLSSFSLHRAARLDEAEAGYRACLDAGEGEATLPLAALLLQRARYAEAAGLLEPLARATPLRADVAINLSVALRHCARADEALAAAQSATRLAPTQVAAWNALGLAALDLGRADEALAAFEAALRIAPGNAALELHRAHALRRLARHADAARAYEASARAKPALADAWSGLGRSLAMLGRTAQSLDAHARALQLAPADREVALEHAVALLQAGRAADAVARLEQAVRSDGGDAQAWAWLGRAHAKAGALVQARAALERAHALDPHDATIAHLHAAFTGAMPADVESEYIRRLFDDFADRFEQTLVGQLGYDTPQRMLQFLRAHGADDADNVLDLGCGTGLMAQYLARAGRRIDGVDLSARMLEHARAKGIYHRLLEAEAGAFLRESSAQWDLVVATDVLNYLPDLQPLFDAVVPRLAPGGAFAFTIERSAGDDTELQAVTARYRHAVARVVEQLQRAGLRDVVDEALVIRMESGQPVAGAMLLARARSSQGA